MNKLVFSKKVARVLSNLEFNLGIFLVMFSRCDWKAGLSKGITCVVCGVVLFFFVDAMSWNTSPVYWKMIHHKNFLTFLQEIFLKVFYK